MGKVLYMLAKGPSREEQAGTQRRRWVFCSHVNPAQTQSLHSMSFYLKPSLGMSWSQIGSGVSHLLDPESPSSSLSGFVFKS